MKKLYTSIILFLVISNSALAQDPAEPAFTLSLPNQPTDLFTYRKTPSFIKKAVLQADGKLIVNSGKGLERIDGNLTDTSFNVELTGEFMGNYNINQMLGLPDGKVMLSMSSGGVVGAEMSPFVRLNADGSLDSTFNPAIPSLAFMVVQPDGKLLVYNSGTIKRLNSDGSIDPTFNFSSVNPMASSKFLLLPDGKIIYESSDSDSKNFRRLNADGSEDTSYFVGAGYDLSTYLNCMLALPDGKVLVGGYFSNYNGVAFENLMRLNADGTVDTSFVFDTDAQTTQVPAVTDLTMDSSGRIIAAFGSYLYAYNLANFFGSVVRINNNGTIDATFDIDLQNGASYIAVLPNQDIIVQSQASTIVDFLQFDGFVKFHPDGTRDESFNNGPGSSSKVRSVAGQSDNKILIAGDFREFNGSSKKFLARLNADGTNDETFNTGTGFSNFVSGVAVQTDGKIMAVGGFIEYNGTPTQLIARLNQDGTLDPSFTPPAFTMTSGRNVVTIQPDGKILLGGSFLVSHLGRSYKSMIRLNSNGTVDTSFFTQGDNTVGFSGEIYAITMQPDGKILVGGKFSGFYLCGICTGMENIVRLNADGTRDTTFTNPGMTNSGTNIPVQAIAVESNGNILVGGAFTSSISFPYSTSKFVRLFPWGGQAGTVYTGSQVKTIFVQPDGKILLGGTAMGSNGKHLIRLNTDLTEDSSFYIEDGFNDNIEIVALRSDGIILVGGDFTTYKGETARRFAALKGNDFFGLQGSNRFDVDNNGCDQTYLPVPFLELSVSNGISHIPNSSGNYHFPLGIGSYTITPILENPEYFTVSPSSIDVTFEGQSAPFNQNFCLTANGTHHDLEIAILPIDDARPGFNATYRIVLRNKGTVPETGSFTFNFDGAISDVSSTTPAAASSTENSITWNFYGLNPLELRYVEVVLNFNSPQESPALIGGENIVFSATSSNVVDEETPNDNTFNLSQTVVNSYDPNDKKCLEGNLVGAEVVGNYVHYLIRFENVGNGIAKNIVVRDEIDASKFDVSSLIPLHGSHLFTTSIEQGNRVEFLFENINLPFAEGSNGGYVAFKIKTVGTLEAGDAFSNTAAIYFDYNAPIQTNNEVTTIELLDVGNFAEVDNFTLYPNPVQNLLQIYNSHDRTVNSIEVFNVAGQLLIAIPNAQNINDIDVSHLTSGLYLIKLKAEGQLLTMRFLKK